MDTLFFLLSAAAIWLTKPPMYIDKIIRDVGLDPDKGTGAFLEGLIVAIIILLVQRAALLAERRASIFLPDYVGGVWMFALLPIHNEEFSDDRRTVGLFLVKPRKAGYAVSFGESFLIDPRGNLIKRGEWSANNIVIDGAYLDFIYTLKTSFKYREERDFEYRGVISLRSRDQKGDYGKS